MSDVVDMFTNGPESACAIPAAPNITTAVNKVVTIFIVSSPKKTYFQTTVSLPPTTNSKPNCVPGPSDFKAIRFAVSALAMLVPSIIRSYAASPDRLAKFHHRARKRGYKK